MSDGTTFSTLDPNAGPGTQRVRNVHGPDHADRSDEVRYVLERLSQQRNFDLILFPADGGLGFRTVQAKRAGLGFEGVLLAVRLDRCSEWHRDQEHRWPSGLSELEIDFAERYAFERADIQVASSTEILDYIRGIGWTPSSNVIVETPYEGATACLYRNLPLTPLVSEKCRPLVTVGVPHYNLGRYLPEALASLAGQTYPNLEILVIDDGSNDPASSAAFERMQCVYPQFRFLRQQNAGIGATRNRGLKEASGEFFIPMDADNVARPDMVERFVNGIQVNPDLSAMTCYYLAFGEKVPLAREEYLYACRPTGGPHTLASIRNVYGDANAIFRTAALRAVGGYEIDRDTSFEDWEAFVKLVNAGHAVGVIPAALFYYRHREAGFSRVTDDYRNHQRVLRQFLRIDHLPASERAVLWGTLVGFHLDAERHRGMLRYAAADRLHALCNKVPYATRSLKWLYANGGRVWDRVRGLL